MLLKAVKNRLLEALIRWQLKRHVRIKIQDSHIYLINKSLILCFFNNYSSIYKNIGKKQNSIHAKFIKSRSHIISTSSSKLLVNIIFHFLQNKVND